MNLNQLEQDCRQLLNLHSHDAAHQLDHIERVVKAAKALAKSEGANMSVVIAAAYCHDLVCYPKNSDKRHLASSHAADKAVAELSSLGYQDDFCHQVHHAIAAHSYSAGIETSRLEAKIVQDADRLDALGAIGTIRCIQVGTQLSHTLYQFTDPFCQHRVPNDSEFTLDHFYQKLLRLPATMSTSAGRELAEQRVEFMKIFLKQLAQEI